MLPDDSFRKDYRLNYVEDGAVKAVYYPDTDTLYFTAEDRYIDLLRNSEISLKDVYMEEKHVYLHEWLHKTLSTLSPIQDILFQLDSCANRLLQKMRGQYCSDPAEYAAEIWAAERIAERYRNSWRRIQEIYAVAGQGICTVLMSDNHGRQDVTRFFDLEAEESQGLRQESMKYIRDLSLVLSPSSLLDLVLKTAAASSHPHNSQAKKPYISVLHGLEENFQSILKTAAEIAADSESSSDPLQQIIDEMPDEYCFYAHPDRADLPLGYNQIEMKWYCDSVLDLRELFDTISRASSNPKVWDKAASRPSYGPNFSIYQGELKELKNENRLKYLLPPVNNVIEGGDELWIEDPKIPPGDLPQPPVRTTLRVYFLQSLAEGEEMISGRQRSEIVSRLREYEDIRETTEMFLDQGLDSDIQRRQEKIYRKTLEL